MATVTREVEIELEDEDLLEMLAQDKSLEEIQEVVFNLDDNVGDWTFTKDLAIAFGKQILESGESEMIEEFLEALHLKQLEDEDDDDEDEDEKEEEVKEASPAAPPHGHVYRDGRCWCGEPSP